MRFRVLVWMLLFLMASALPAATDAFAQAKATVAVGDPHEQLRQIEQQPLYQRWRQREETQAGGESKLMEALRLRIQEMMDSLWEWFRGLFRSHSAHGTAAGTGHGLAAFLTTMGWIALILFLLAIVVLIIRIVQGASHTKAHDAALSREQVAAALQEGNALALGGDQWLDEAGRLAQEKNFRAMYRALYLALLSGLHSRGKIDFNRHHTNWTYVNRYRGEAPEREVFSSMTELFDSVWYGLGTAEQADIQMLRRQVHALIGTAQGELGTGGGAHAK